MTVHLVTAGDDPAAYSRRHDAFLQLSRLATYDTSVVPLTLTYDTRRGISAALSEALLYAGRAQPVPTTHHRRAQRADAGRLAVALRHSRQDIVISGAQHLHPVDVSLFTRTAELAGVDLWLIADAAGRPTTRAALHAAAHRTHRIVDVVAEFYLRPRAGRRLNALPCEAALPLNSGTSAAPACARHHDAAGCVLTAFGHALATARTDPTRVRARLHELTELLPERRRWAIYAAARDPYRYAERASELLPLTWRERAGLRLGQLAPTADRLFINDTQVPIPAHLRGVLTAHHDIRVAEGSGPDRLFLIPTDDGVRGRGTRVA